MIETKKLLLACLIIVISITFISIFFNVSRTEPMPNKYWETYAGSYQVIDNNKVDNDTMEVFFLSQDGISDYQLFIKKDQKWKAQIKRKGHWSADSTTIEIDISSKTGITADKYYFDRGYWRNAENKNSRLVKW